MRFPAGIGSQEIDGVANIAKDLLDLTLNRIVMVLQESLIAKVSAFGRSLSYVNYGLIWPKPIGYGHVHLIGEEVRYGLSRCGRQDIGLVGNARIVAITGEDYALINLTYPDYILKVSSS